MTLEAVKLVQGYKMSSDPQLRSEKVSTQVTVQSSNLNEELGQIQFVFSDKTGTLTCNKMDFKRIMINGIVYGNATEEQQDNISDDSLPKIPNVDFHDANLLNILNNPENNQHEFVKHAVFFLALCHTVVAEYKQNEVIYNTSSPDELALINFAKFCGVEFKGVEDNNLLVEFKGNVYKFKLLQTFEFNSTRKKQSVIFENDHKEIYLYCKGADSVIENQLSSLNK